MTRAALRAGAALGCGSLVLGLARCDDELARPALRDPSSVERRGAAHPFPAGLARAHASALGAKTARSEPAAAEGLVAPPETAPAAPVSEPLVSDPGVRPGPAGAGAPDAKQPIDFDGAAEIVAAAAACLPTLSNVPDPVEPGVASGGASVAGALEACAQAVIRFQEVASVSGTLESGVGLGPTYNANSCASCHSQPAVLGAGVSLGSPQRPNEPNPQVGLATLHGAKNPVPFFITPAGPVREARFTTDGAVHDLFTIAGRSDAEGCGALPPDFDAANARGILRFRIPIATYGDGLVENVPDDELRANLARSQEQFETGGAFQISAVDGTIARFGWKAQNKSILSFSAEAYNVEMGVTNEAFPNERAGGASRLKGCTEFNATPEDALSLEGKGKNTASDVSADIVNFALAIRLSRPPTRATAPFTIGSRTITQDQLAQGESQFAKVGCASCHTPSLTTAPSSLEPALSSVTFHPYSDFALHHMGSALADGITQGAAAGDQFRTAPLWGIGQRQWFLHDGRTDRLTAAIAWHGGDATGVMERYNRLSASDQQAIIDFLRSL